ncbi:MAG: branched-chain amino acid ABC transporter permease [Pseudonocardiaceae bacterium]|nr:branched-chain amino acid ABC transporter permease [Pseudonocardiaceae bacterium]
MLVTVLVLVAVALYLPHYYAPYRVFQFTEVLVFAIAVLSLNLLTGYTGQISLGHSFFFAIGAYTTAVMFRDLDVAFVIPFVVAFVVAFVVGFLIGIPALRLSGVYLALVTIALAVITPPLLTRFEGLTGGSQGINIDTPTAPAWSGLADDQWLYYICLVVAAVVFLLARNLVRGGVGLSMTAVRDNELAARTMGVNPAVPKTRTFAYSAGFAGVAGALYTLVVGLVAPGSFTIILAINLLVGTVVGGMATIAGAVFGAAFIGFVPVYTSGINPALGGVIYGAVVILIMFVMPGGVMGLARRIRGWLVTLEEPADRRRASGTGQTETAGSLPAARAGAVDGGTEQSGTTDPGTAQDDRPGEQTTTGDRREN